MKFILIGNHRPEWIGRAAERSALAFEMIGRLGLSVDVSYYTQGQFDFVTIIEAPDAESASAFSVWYARMGFGTVQTMRAFTGSQMEMICERTTSKQ